VAVEGAVEPPPHVAAAASGSLTAEIELCRELFLLHRC